MVKDAHTPGSGHPIPAAVARAEAEIRAVADTPTWSLRPAEVRDTLTRIAQARAEHDELEARLLAEGEHNGAFTEVGATTAAAWLAHATKMTHPEARRRAKFATALPHHDPTREAMTAGQVLADQAAVICAAVEELPDQPALRAQCEKELVTLAEHHDAKELRVLGRRVLEIVDPDAADAHEGQLLEREERDAAKATIVLDVGDRRRQGARQVHLLRTAGRDASQGAHEHRRPQASARERRDLRPRTPHRRTTRPSLRRVRQPATPPTSSPTPAASTPPSSSP